MSTTTERLKDAVYHALKRTQRRVLAPRYEELRLRQGWLRGDPTAPYDERVYPAVRDLASIESVIVFKPDEIGDAVHSLPAIAELRRYLPDARMFCLCRPLTAPLFERSGLFDGIAQFESGTKFRPKFRSLRRALRELPAETFDLSVYLRTNPTTFRRFMSIPARMRLHPIDPRMRSKSPYQAPISLWTEERKHQVLQLLEIVSLVTRREYTFSDVSYPPLAWTEEDRRALDVVFGHQDAGPYVVIHPFAKEETRRYPPEYWPPLVDVLRRELGVPLVAIGGPEDEGQPVPDGVVPAQGRLTIGQTGYLLSRAAGFIGNLSGPAHLAAALDTPTVTLMGGNSLPVEWAPVGDSLVLTVEVPCSPCHRATCAGYGLACLVGLTPERVAPEILSFLRTRLRERRSDAVTEAPVRS